MATLSKTVVKSPWICDPLDDRCVSVAAPTFMPGISVRHSQSCSMGICGLTGCGGGNWRLTGQGTLDRAEWLKGWAMTQLLTRGFVDCAEHPLGQRGGGWWADAYRSTSNNARFRSGSKLWSLLWTHGGAINDVLQMAKAYAREALSYLQSWGVVSSIVIDAFWLTRFPFAATVQLNIRLTGPGVGSSFSIQGSQQPNAQWLWAEHKPPQPSAGRTVTRWSS